MLNEGNTNRTNQKEKHRWLFLLCLFITILLIATILYFCPLKYVQVWEHPGTYYSVFQSINYQYQWILITSIGFNILYIAFSLFSLAKFRIMSNKRFKILIFTILILCIIFIVLTYIFAFKYSNHYPKYFNG